MKKTLGMIFAAGMMMGASSASVQAANMGEMMMGMMQCSASCSTQYMQCVASAQQVTSDPAAAMSQIQANFAASTQCGQEAMACNASCK